VAYYNNYHKTFDVQDNWKSLLCDGLHLSESGSELVHKLILPVVQEKLRSYLPEGMADDDVILPTWRDVSNTNPCLEVVNWVNKYSNVK